MFPHSLQFLTFTVFTNYVYLLTSQGHRYEYVRRSKTRIIEGHTNDCPITEITCLTFHFPPLIAIFTVRTLTYKLYINLLFPLYTGHRDRMVVGFITNYAISAYHH